jgi:hypothetical protein
VSIDGLDDERVSRAHRRSSRRLLLPLGRGTDDDQETLRGILEPGLHMDAVPNGSARNRVSAVEMPGFLLPCATMVELKISYRLAFNWLYF